MPIYYNIIYSNLTWGVIVLTFITSLWYLCGAACALYVIFCIICILRLERKACKCQKALFIAYRELDVLFEGGERSEVRDVYGLSCAFTSVLELKQDPGQTFEFYRQKEHFRELAGEYNAAVQQYNQLIMNYPSCVLARVMGKEPVERFTCE